MIFLLSISILPHSHPPNTDPVPLLWFYIFRKPNNSLSHASLGHSFSSLWYFLSAESSPSSHKVWNISFYNDLPSFLPITLSPLLSPSLLLKGVAMELSSLICFCIITFLSWAVSIISHQEIILTFQQLHNNSLQTWLKLLSHTLKLSSYLLHFLFIINLLLRGYQRLCLETIIFQRLLKIRVDKIYFRDKRYKKRFIFIWHFGCPPQVYFCTNWF